MRAIITWCLLVLVKLVSTICFRLRSEWVEPVPEHPWRGIRLVAILHHTSLFEWLLGGFAPWSLLWQFARHGVLPVAEKTIRRPVVGWFFGILVRHVVVITRQRDHTWNEVLKRIDDPKAVIVILPEGRMKRRNGLDSSGNPMTVRGGIADILQSLPSGRMLLVYSGGLHHIQAPGEALPRPFRTIRMRKEVVDIPAYVASLGGIEDPMAFRRAVIQDLERRRDSLCPTRENLAREGTLETFGRSRSAG